MVSKLMQLIDPDYREELEVDGVRFEIRAANGILKADMAMAFVQDDDGNMTAPASRLLPTVAKIITKFHDYPDNTPREVLDGLPDGVLVQRIFSAVSQAVMLSGDERKNSGSSSDSQSTDSTGTAETVTGNPEDVSDFPVAR